MSTRRILGRAGSEAAGSVTFNSPATWVSPPRLLNVTVTGVGAAGEPGQVGVAGTGGARINCQRGTWKLWNWGTKGLWDIMESKDMVVQEIEELLVLVAAVAVAAAAALEGRVQICPGDLDMMEGMDMMEMLLILMVVRMHMVVVEVMVETVQVLRETMRMMVSMEMMVLMEIDGNRTPGNPGYYNSGQQGDPGIKVPWTSRRTWNCWY